MTAFEVAREVISGLPAYVKRPGQEARSRNLAATEIAYWMSRAAILANALLPYDPGTLEYESWQPLPPLPQPQPPFQEKP